jgi:dipeptidase E
MAADVPTPGRCHTPHVAGHIVAIGGGSMLEASSKIERHVLELAGSERPRVCFLATAVGDHAERVLGFYQAFAESGCELTHVELFGMPERPADRVRQQDVVYVSGGNTANLLALWRVHGIDEAVREVWERGGVLAGWSAGANCWFEDCVTDSFGPLRRLGDGLGLLPGSFCPHYDVEMLRRSTYRKLVAANGMAAGFAADDDAAFVFAGAELQEIVSQREGARGYRVTGDGEEPLEARLL